MQVENLLNVELGNTQSNAEAQLQFQEFAPSQVTVAELNVEPESVLFENTKFSGQQESENPDRKQKAEPSFWGLNYYQQFFDVNTVQVRDRILYSTIPRSQLNYLEHIIKPKPDLYGPFWICLTLVFTIAVSKNLVNYQSVLNQLTLTHDEFHWKYDFHTVSYAATGIFSYTWLLPLAVWGILWWQGGKPTITLLELHCLYGYSLAIFIPVSMLWTVQLGWLQWVLLVLSAGTSGSVLVISLLPATRAAGQHTSRFMCLVVFAVHVMLATVVMVLFFQASGVDNTISSSAAASSQIPVTVHHNISSST